MLPDVVLTSVLMVFASTLVLTAVPSTGLAFQNDMAPEPQCESAPLLVTTMSYVPMSGSTKYQASTVAVSERESCCVSAVPLYVTPVTGVPEGAADCTSTTNKLPAFVWEYVIVADVGVAST